MRSRTVLSLSGIFLFLIGAGAIALIIIATLSSSTNLNPGQDEGEQSTDDPPNTDIDDAPVDPLPGPNPTDRMSSYERALLDAYISTFVKDNGAIISNPTPVAWCPNSCIGCGDDITSEAVARFASYAAKAKQKDLLDREIAFYYTVMRHPSTGHMMWKLDADGKAGSCGGQNSAVDSELIFIEGLLIADEQWQTDSAGRSYRQTAREVMDSLKAGVLMRNGKSYLPYCMYPQGNETRPCRNVVYLGYVNLAALKRMCEVDTFWCAVHSDSRQLMIQAVQNNGIYSAYNLDSQQFEYIEAPIHPMWALRHIVESKDNAAWLTVKPFYDHARAEFMSSGKICQEFQPGKGCKLENPSLFIYADYLRMAHARSDVAFAERLTQYIERKGAEDGNPLTNPDNYGNVAVLEALSGNS